MSGLFNALGLARSALNAADVALRTAGQNIANASAPGYTRQRVQMVARVPDDFGRLQIGTGVEVARIGRVMDQRLEQLLREARSSLGDLDARDRVLARVETIMGELDGNSISGALSRFFDAVEDLVNRPEDPTTRTLLLARGAELSETFKSVDAGLRQVQRDLEADVSSAVGQINELTAGIASLNQQIVNSENGGIDLGSANDLRDRREELVKQLSDLVEVKVVETSTGSLNVLAGSDFLVVDNQNRELTLDTDAAGDVLVSQVRFAKDGQKLTVNGGQLAGILAMRDGQITGLRGEIEVLAQTVISEVNRIHSQGEGLIPYQEIIGTTLVANPDGSLAEADLLPPARNGSFDLRIVDPGTGLADTYNIAVDLDGLGGSDATLRDLADLINAAVGADHPGVVAEVTLDGRLKISSDDPTAGISFANDSSGVLAGLGMATFFKGSGAGDMAVNSALEADPRLVAAGRGGGTTDASNASALAALRDSKVLQNGGVTAEEFYRGLVGALGVERAQAREMLENQTTVTEHLQNERAAISGVNLDEESIDLIQYQRAYQGAARFLTVVDTLLEALLNA